MGKSVNNGGLSLSVGAGSATSPSVAFATGTGFYTEDDVSVSVATSATKRARISSAGLALVTAGTAGAPSLVFEDATTGLYRSTTNELSVAISGTQRYRLNSQGLACLGSGTYFSAPDGTGTLTAPQYSFANDTDTGFGSRTGGEINFLAGGTEILRGNSTSVTAYVPIRFNAGSASAPSVSFISDTNTGIYNPSADQVGVACGGTLNTTFSSTAVTFDKLLSLPNGTAAAPSLTFTNDTDTGFYATGTANEIGFATGGTNRATLSSTKLALAQGLSLGGGSDIMSVYSITTPTPTMTLNGAGFGGVTTNCKAIQVGKLVTVVCTISWTSISGSSGAWAISNLLPVAPAVDVKSGPIGWDTTADVNVADNVWFYSSGGTTLYGAYTDSGGLISSSFASSNFDATGTIRFTISYIA